MSPAEAQAVLDGHGYAGQGTRGIAEPARSEIKAALLVLEVERNRVAEREREQVRNSQIRAAMAAAEQARVAAAEAAHQKRVEQERAEALELAAKNTTTEPAPE